MRRCPRCNSFFDDSTQVCPYDGEALVDIQLGGPNTRGLEGQVFAGRYHVEQLLGEGGMGIVYKARDQQTGETIALKVLHREIGNDERSVKRFFSEARVLSSLSHPHIIRQTDFGRSNDGSLYIAMELLKGNTAEELISQGRMDPKEAIDVVDQVANALGEAHLQGVIHRDLKPPNIFVRREPDNSLHVTVLDFGIAKIAGQQSLTATGKVMGTPSYMAPEQISGKKPDPRMDIYALGALAYELLTGEPPFTGDGPIGILYKHLNEPPRPLSDHITINPQLGEIILKFLAKKPGDRPRNILAVRELLAPFLASPERITSQEHVEEANLVETLAVDSDEAERRAAEYDKQRKASVAHRPPSVGPAPSWQDKPPVDYRETRLSGPQISAPDEEDDDEDGFFGGAGILLWLGAAMIAVLVAAILAIAVFLLLGGWTVLKRGLSSASTPPAAIERLAHTSHTCNLRDVQPDDGMVG